MDSYNSGSGLVTGGITKLAAGVVLGPAPGVSADPDWPCADLKIPVAPKESSPSFGCSRSYNASF